MKIMKNRNESGLYDIHINNDNKELILFFGGNGDLYWIFKNDNSDDKSLIITKENYAIYSLFEQLYLDIKNINIFDESENMYPTYVTNKEELEQYIKEQQKNKKLYRKYNISNYNELFSKNEKTITWYSDETAHEVANIVKINRLKDSFKIEFFRQPQIKGYDSEIHINNIIPIRFRNSGSTYTPFNFIFLRMYNKMQNIDDVKDFNHQYHMEEYMYQKDKIDKSKPKILKR